MEIWYSFIDSSFHFSWTNYQFMKNALLAILLITPLYGLLSTMIVNNKLAFFSDSLGHSTLTGIALGTVIGINDPRSAMAVFAILFSFGLVLVKSMQRSSTDTTIGVFSSTAIALGLVILSKGGNFANYSSFLIGDLLSITSKDIVYILIAFGVILFVWLAFFNPFLLLSINPILAHSRGVRLLSTEFLFVSMIAITVTVSIEWVGLLVINSLLLLPAAASRNISKNVRQYHLFSVIISVVSGTTGLILSYYLDTATGATVVLVGALLYILTMLFRTE